MQHQASGATSINASTFSISILKPIQLAAALLLGMVILYVSGFVNTSALHNVAHDTRHSQGFPCH